MNYLGIDYGKSKIGLAISKGEARVAIPFKIVPSVDSIKEIIESEEIDEIVVGYPITLSGQIGVQAIEVDKFIEKIKNFKKKIHKQDERFSTKSAKEAVLKGDEDASSAALILQTYLDKI